MRRLNASMFGSGARDSDRERHVAMREVNDAAVDVIGQQRTARAALGPVRTHHEVIHDELELRPSNRSDNVCVPDCVSNTYDLSTFTIGSRRRSALERVLRSRERFLLDQKVPARGDPLIARHDSMLVHDRLLVTECLNRSSSGRICGRASSSRVLQAPRSIWRLRRWPPPLKCMLDTYRPPAEMPRSDDGRGSLLE